MATSVSRDQHEQWVRAFASALTQNKEYLTRLDSAIGDADHGINMDRGFTAVVEKLNQESMGDIGAICKMVGMTLVSKVGGAAGPLYGTFFLHFGTAVDAKEALTASEWAGGLEAGLAGVVMRGKAEPGDKTMVDALTPAVQTLRDALGAGSSFEEALLGAAGAAWEGMKATIPLVARKGRASYLGERSAGHQDPGATSSYLLVATAAQTLAGGDPPGRLDNTD